MNRNPELKDTGYEIFILLLSILSIANIIFLAAPWFDQTAKGVVIIMDSFLTLIFLIDFLYRLFTTDSKAGYFFRNWGWADLLASLPMQQLKIFRIFRILRVGRLLHEFGLKGTFSEVIHNRAGSALYLTIFMVMLVLEFGGAGIVAIEAGAPDANIKTASDGVWWAFVTITTVGYGDRYPTTGSGRLLGMATMMLGVGLFGVLTGFLANRFLAPSGAEPDEANGAEAARIAELSAAVATMQDQIARQEQITHSLESLLARHVDDSASEEKGAEQSPGVSSELGTA